MLFSAEGYSSLSSTYIPYMGKDINVHTLNLVYGLTHYLFCLAHLTYVSTLFFKFPETY